MSIRKNLAYNVLYQVLIIIMPLITTPYISRVIGADGIGIQSYTYSIVKYFVLFAMLGVNNHGNRSIAMAKEDKETLSKTFISIYSVQVIMSILMFISYNIFLIFLDSEYKLLFRVQSIYILAAILDINWFFFGMEEFKLTVIRNSIIKILCTLSIFIFVKNANDLLLYTLILCLGNLISQLVLWKFVGKYITFTKVNINDIKNQIKPMIILFIPVIAISIYNIMDKIMLGSMSTIIQVGYYENSEKIISIPISVISALGTVMLPKISNLQVKGDTEQLKRYISISMEFVIFIAFGAVFGIIGVSPVLIPIFLGNEFVQCVDIVSILSITILFVSWANTIRTQYLIPKKKDGIYIKSTILGAIVNLISNLFLISRYGALGAVFGTILAEASVASYQTFKVRKELSIKTYFEKTIFYIIPGILMCIIIRYIGNMLGLSILTSIIQIIIGTIVYLFIGLAYMFITKNEVVYYQVRKKLSKNFKIGKFGDDSMLM